MVIRHRKVQFLSAYRRAGWRHAPRVAHLRNDAAKRLGEAAAALPDPFGLAVFDAWRPLALQRALHEAAYEGGPLPEGFVAAPSVDPATPPPHLTGGAVDLTLTWQGAPLRLGTDFDDFTALAHPTAFEDVPGKVRQLRRLLVQVMQDAGFVQDGCEWWHFEYGTRRWAALVGASPLYGPASAPCEPST